MTRKSSLKILSVLMLVLVLIASMPTYAFASLIKTEEKPQEKSAPYETEVLMELTEQREEREKHFLLNDGTVKAVTYSQPIHYRDANGNWIDIDNFLTLSGGEYSTKNKTEIKFANKSGSSKLVSIKDGDYKIEFAPINAQKTSVIIKNGEKTASRKFDEVKLLSDLASSARYENIYDGIDIEYILAGSSIKENIIINEAKESYIFAFEIKLNGLSAVLKDNEIHLCDLESGSTVYEIPAPYMYDASRELSTDVEYALEKITDHKYKLTVTASEAWINSEERAFPVTVDPIIRKNSNVKTAYVSPDGYIEDTYVFVGDFMGERDLVGYVKFNTMPTLPNGAVLTDADLLLYNISANNFTSEEFYIGLYEATGNWIGNVTYASRNTYMNVNAPLNYVKINESRSYAFDITELYTKWQNGGTNNGVCLKNLDFSGNNAYKDYLAIFTAQDSNNYPNPCIELTYTSPEHTKGLESYYTYIETSAGNAGTGYINTFTGELTFVHDVFTTADNILPYTLSLVYSSNDKAWHFNTEESITHSVVSGIDYYKWIDADGTCHYFSPIIRRNTFGNIVMYQYNDTGNLVETTTPTVFYDNDGLGLKLSLSSERIVLSDDKGNEKIFVHGALSKIKDSFGNERSFVYTADGRIKGIHLTPIGTQGITQLSITYGTNKATVTNAQAGISAQINYTSNRVTSVVYTYGTGSTYTVNYSYDTNGYLSTATDTASGAQILYQWDGEYATKIFERSVQDSTTEIGEQLMLFYSNGVTHTRNNCDDNFTNENDLYTAYHFDSKGRVVTAYSFDMNENIYGIYGNQLNDMYRDNGITEKTNNSIKSTTSISTLAVNLLKNSGFSTTDHWSSTSAGASVTQNSVVQLFGINYGKALKIEATPDSAHHTVFQTVEITTPGMYTLSYSMLKNIEPGSQARVKIYRESTGALVASSDPYTYNENGTIATEWEREYFSYGLATGTYRISIEFTSVTTSGEYILVDNVMLEKGNVSNYYSAYDNGDFSQITLNGTEMNAALSSGKLALTPTLFGKSSYSFRLYADNIVENQNMIISAYGKAANGLSNTNNGSTPSRFGILLKAQYTNTVLEKFIPFRVGNYENQYVFDFVNYKPAIEDESGARETLHWIDVVLVYDNNIGTAYFDNVTLSYGSSSTQYEYNSMGYVSEVTDGEGGKTTYTYAENNVDLLCVTDKYGREYSGTYDGNHNINGTGYYSESEGEITNAGADYTRNSFGQIVQTDISSSESTKRLLTQTLYNSDTASSAFSMPSMTIDENGAITRYFYNSKGMLIGVCDSVGNGVIYEYNAYGELLYAKLAVYDSASNSMVEAGASKQVAYEYNAYHALKSISTGSTEYSFTHNEFNAIDAILIGQRTLVDYEYLINNGNLRKLTYGNGATVEYTYDILDRLVGVCYNGIEKTKYVYASNGSIASVIDLQNDTEYRYYHDNSGKLINEKVVKNDETYLYRTYLYDEYGRLEKTISHHTFAEHNVSNINTTYQYNQDGSIVLIDRTTGGDISYSYDAFGRLIGQSITNVNPNQSNTTTTIYVYGDTSNRAYTRLTRVTVNGQSTSYTYDGAGNITRITYPNGKAVTYKYDQSNQLIREDNQNLNRSYTYTYDNSGNLLSKKEYTYTASTVNISTKTPIQVLNYGYNDSEWGDLLTSFGGYGITYDAIGNPLSYLGMSLSWSDGRLLTGVGNNTTYTYNQDGIRIGKNVGGTRTEYVLNGTQIERELVYNSANTLIYDKLYFYDANGIISSAIVYALEGSTYKAYYYTIRTNVQGDVLGVYNQSGVCLVSYTYDAWGNFTTSAPTSSITNEEYMARELPFRYRGYYYDDETYFYYLNSRYYDSLTGRFINADSVEYLGANDDLESFNLFAYCSNNPVMYVDPTGNFPILALVLGITALVGLGLTIGGVTSDNNTLTAIGLTMVAIPALISGVGAIAAGVGGATLTGIVGGVTTLAGVGTGLFASTEYQEAFTGSNWMLDAGMSEGWYNGLMLTTATIATAGTFASSFMRAFDIKSIQQFGRFGKYGQEGYRGMKFTTGTGKTRVLSFHTHSHVVGKNISQWHWQLQKWNPKAMEVAGTVAQWIWWNLRRI